VVHTNILIYHIITTNKIPTISANILLWNIYYNKIFNVHKLQKYTKPNGTVPSPMTFEIGIGVVNSHEKL